MPELKIHPNCILPESETPNTYLTRPSELRSLLVSFTFLLDVANGSFRLGTGCVLARFGSLSGQPCSGSGEARIWITFGSTMFRLGTGSGQVKFGLGLLRIAYNSLVWIGKGQVNSAGWDSVQCF